MKTSEYIWIDLGTVEETIPKINMKFIYKVYSITKEQNKIK